MMSDPELVDTSSPLVPGPDPQTAPITVLCVADDPTFLDLVGTDLGRADRIEVEMVTSPTSALQCLDTADCVVSDYDMAELDGIELLADVRDQTSDIPFVLFAATVPANVADVLSTSAWTAYIEKDDQPETMALLAQRIYSLVGYRRMTVLARRALAAIELVSDGMAIVDPDGTVQFANRQFARQFGTTNEELAGREWRDLYPCEEVERLEADAFPSLDDGWRWIGVCECRRDDGGTFTAKTCIDSLEDGSLVFTVSDGASDDS